MTVTTGKNLILAPALAAAIAVAQNTNFEVASVKSNKSPDTRSMNLQTQPGGRLVATGVPLYLVIEWAYGLDMQSIRMSGGPEWTRSERYDIDAKAPEGAIPVDLPARIRQQQIRPMLQALLAERFKLVVRRESKEMPVYVITVAKGGLKSAKSNVEEKDCGPDVPCHRFMGGQGRGVHGKSVSTEDLISFVENWSDRPMIDRTGLTGLYNMDSDGWVPLRGPGGGNEGLDDPVRPTLFTVFERQLGLKVDSDKAKVDVFVIEHVERPTEN